MRRCIVSPFACAALAFASVLAGTTGATTAFAQGAPSPFDDHAALVGHRHIVDSHVYRVPNATANGATGMALGVSADANGDLNAEASEVDDATTFDIYTLGQGGLVVRWSDAGIPMAWAVVDGATWIERGADAMFAGGNGSVEALDLLDLRAIQTWQTLGSQRCVGADAAFAWSTESWLYIAPDVALSAVEAANRYDDPERVPEVATTCSITTEGEAFLTWLDADEVRVIGPSLAWTEQPIAWPLPSVARVISSDPLTLLGATGAGQSVTVTVGLTMESATEPEPSTLDWFWNCDTAPAAATTCVRLDAQATEVGLVDAARAIIAVAPSAAATIFAHRDGWTRVRHSGQVNTFANGDIAFAGVTANGSAVIGCDSTTSDVVALNPVNNEILGSFSVSQCSVVGWYAGSEVVATADGIVRVWRGNEWELATFGERAVGQASASIGGGRYLVSSLWDPSCALPVDTLLFESVGSTQPQTIVDGRCGHGIKLIPIANSPSVGAVVDDDALLILGSDGVVLQRFSAPPADILPASRYLVSAPLYRPELPPPPLDEAVAMDQGDGVFAGDVTVDSSTFDTTVEATGDDLFWLVGDNVVYTLTDAGWWPRDDANPDWVIPSSRGPVSARVFGDGVLLQDLNGLWSTEDLRTHIVYEAAGVLWGYGSAQVADAWQNDLPRELWRAARSAY